MFGVGVFLLIMFSLSIIIALTQTDPQDIGIVLMAAAILLTPCVLLIYWGRKLRRKPQPTKRVEPYGTDSGAGSVAGLDPFSSENGNRHSFETVFTNQNHKSFTVFSEQKTQSVPLSEQDQKRLESVFSEFDNIFSQFDTLFPSQTNGKKGTARTNVKEAAPAPRGPVTIDCPGCGAKVTVPPNQALKCEYCGTQVTSP